MDIPARYCTGYLGDIGVPPYCAGMDFSAWFEAYLGDRWDTFDARHNKPRIGRILMARGRDATDVAIVTSFGPCTLAGFKVITDEAHALPLHQVRRPGPSRRRQTTRFSSAIPTKIFRKPIRRRIDPTQFLHNRLQRFPGPLAMSGIP